MAENSKIEWTDHTCNFWVGCERISPACDHCYAESWAKRSGHPELWRGERRRTKPNNWNNPLEWNDEAAALGVTYRVFTNSLADFFDNQIPAEWRRDAWDVIRATPHLRWQILTKRPGNIAAMLPADWGRRGWPHVWLGCTVVTQAEADRDWPKLARVPAAVRFLSMEPLLERVDLARMCEATGDRAQDDHLPDWVIVGGESGGAARPMSPAWVLDILGFCHNYGVPFFFKQWGEWMPFEDTPRSAEGSQVDWADGHMVSRVGKRKSGRKLGGRTYDELPEQG